MNSDGDSTRKRTKKGEEKNAAKANKEVAKATKKVTDLNAHPILAGLERSAKRRKMEMKTEDKNAAAKALIKLMTEAVMSDNDANSKKKPALNKLLLLSQVTKELRRIPIQEEFLDYGGCEQLADWLYPLPDGTYPNVKIV